MGGQITIYPKQDRNPEEVDASAGQRVRVGVAEIHQICFVLDFWSFSQKVRINLSLFFKTLLLSIDSQNIFQHDKSDKGYFPPLDSKFLI